MPRDVCWDVLPEYRRLLLGPTGLRLDEWLAAGTARVVKHGQRRTVYRVDLPEQTLFLKHYRCTALADLGRHVLRASASRREFRKALELARRQVPAVRPLALGERIRAGIVRDNFLVTEGIPDGEPLNSFATRLAALPADDERRLRWKLLAALARLCAAAHDAGVFHDDFHSGNLLVRVDTCSGRPDDDRQPQLYLIDVPGVRFSGPLNWQRTRQSLVMLSSDWGAKISAADRFRFWKEYLRQRVHWTGPEPATAAGEIVRTAREYAWRVLRGRAKRALRTNRDFYALRTPLGRAHAVSQITPADLVAAIEELGREPHLPREPNGFAGSARLTETGGAVIMRQFPLKRGWADAILPSRRSAALHAWMAGHALLERGIPALRPLAVFCVRGWARPRTHYLWSDSSSSGASLAERMDEEDGRAWFCQRGAAALGQIVGRMHAWRIVHDNLRPECFLVAGDGEQTGLLLSDPEHVRFRRRLTKRAQARNLRSLVSHLGVSIGTDLPRWEPTFCDAYLRELRWTADGARAVTREVFDPLLRDQTSVAAGEF